MLYLRIPISIPFLRLTSMETKAPDRRKQRQCCSSKPKSSGQNDVTRRRLTISCAIFFLIAHFASTEHLDGQSNSGELRLKVLDPDGIGLQSSVRLVCEANQVRRSYVTDESGALEAKGLPFGIYRIEISRAGFTTYSGIVEIRSAIPANLQFKLPIATTQTTVVVESPVTFMDPHRTGTISRVGSDTKEHASIALPGRSVIDLVGSQPGWVLESNGWLHPR